MKRLDSHYNPEQFEPDIYARWESSGAFKPDPKAPKTPYSIIMPPPNANGSLHAGHGMYTVDDILTRFHRMRGHRTLWLPGTDHAGIETQVVFERELEKTGQSRFDFTPSEFYDATMAFVRAHEHTMIDQMRSLGLSADWSRLKFTLDPDIIEVVYETFHKLHDDGLIYRANRIVNWCPRCNAGFADIEIKYREQLDPLYYIKYGPFVLATVRPETKFGDTAIAVHPSDERYQHYIGQDIEAEGLLGNFRLKVIGDHYVNPEFGTGVVKVTPAHDPNDWEMGIRHNLEVKQVIGTDGKLTKLAGKYAGMPAADARPVVASDLEKLGLMDHIDMNYSHSVAYHGRCGTLIEPLVTEQWWLAVAELKKPAIKAIKSGDITYFPANFKKMAIDWLEGLKDWNISRQIWWGIRIPVYYNASGDMSKPDYIVATTEEEAKATYGEGGYEAETDTLDTWFSSGQWPFATLMTTGDIGDFYPTSVMGTMRDIQYLWVTRMIMFGLYRTGQVPFRDVYLWGSVNDAKGKKMSKSKGNVTNPLDLTSKYGTDALRLALTIGVTPGLGGALSDSKVEGYRNFANKLWNVARFILSQLPADFKPGSTPPPAQNIADEWILAKLNGATTAVTDAILGYRLSEAGQIVYSLVWDDFADWYIEASKVASSADILIYGLETILKLLHPIAPFVTEAIWSHLDWHTEQLITAAWPEVVPNKKRTNKSPLVFDRLREVISATRSVTADERLVGPVLLTTDSSLVDHANYLKALGKIADVKLVEKGTGLYLGTRTPAWIDATTDQITARLGRLKSLRDQKQAYLEGLNAKLANTGYTASAPASVVEQTRQLRADTLVLVSKLDEQLANLK